MDKKHLVIIFIVGIMLSCFSAVPLSAERGDIHVLRAEDLRPGDVLLQSLYSWAAMLIEQEEQSDYSHSALVLHDVQGNIMAAEALGTVSLTDLKTFIKRSRPGRRILVRRYKEFAHFNEQDVQKLNNQLKSAFYDNFSGSGFDAEFLWNNTDDKGREKYYCSEFVVKLTGNFLRLNISPKPMTFRINREHWINYFNGEPPDGEPGVSPGDIERSALLYTVGYLE